MVETSDTSPETVDSASVDLDCYCQLDGVIDLLSRQYAMQVICVVGAIGPARYGEIEASFDGVSSSTLSTRLNELVDAGYLSRHQYEEIPPRVEYDLTGAGEQLCERLQPLLEWASDQDDLPS